MGAGGRDWLYQRQHRPARRAGARALHGAVSLHLYAPPIRRVKLYEPDNDRVVQRQPGFFTIGLGRSKKREESAMQESEAPEALSWDI